MICRGAQGEGQRAISQPHQAVAPKSEPPQRPWCGLRGRHWPASAVNGQPGDQDGWGLEVEQGSEQGFQLLQRQRLNLGGGGLAEGAAAAVELAKSNAAGLSLAAFLAALSKPVLYRPGVAAITMISAFLDQGGWQGEQVQ